MAAAAGPPEGDGAGLCIISMGTKEMGYVHVALVWGECFGC